MNLRHKIALSCFSATILALGCLAGAVAQTSPYIYENGTEAASRGIIDVNDAKFDSRDLGKIYTEVNGGKTAIANQMNTTAGLGTVTPSGGSGTFYTFADLVSGVDTTYANGKAATWTDIQNAANNGTISSNFASVNSVDTLAAAVDVDNISYMATHAPEHINNLGNFALAVTSDPTRVNDGSTPYSPTNFGYIYKHTLNLLGALNTAGIPYNEVTAENFIYDWTIVNQEQGAVYFTKKLYDPLTAQLHIEYVVGGVRSWGHYGNIYCIY